MILVVGSTGVLGSEIVRQLCEQNKPVRAFVRKSSDPEKVARLENLGAEIVEGDLTDKASLVAACQGTDTVIMTATTPPHRHRVTIQPRHTYAECNDQD
jgi:uncharacterized protein YbjT (DUF2867 family)